MVLITPDPGVIPAQAGIHFVATSQRVPASTGTTQLIDVSRLCTATKNRSCALRFCVIPAQAGIHFVAPPKEVPACAGTTQR
jgi:hypothetical protein